MKIKPLPAGHVACFSNIRMAVQCFQKLNSYFFSAFSFIGLNKFWGGVYMTPGRLSPRSEFTPVPSHGSIFVYMIPPQNVMPARVTPAWVHPGCCTGARISLRYEISQRYHVNAKRPPVSVWNRSAGWLEQVGHAYCLLFWITRVFYQREVYLQITRYEMAQSSCKRDTKSKSQPAVKLAPLRVLSCKHPLK